MLSFDTFLFWLATLRNLGPEYNIAAFPSHVSQHHADIWFLNILSQLCTSPKHRREMLWQIKPKQTRNKQDDAYSDWRKKQLGVMKEWEGVVA